MIVPYFVYREDGTVVRSGTCPIDHVKQQASTGERVAIGEARDNLHRVDLSDPESPMIVAKDKQE